MSVGVHNRKQGSASIPTSDAVPPIASLVVRLHHDGRQCTASFNGSLTGTTRTTIDGLADLLTGEESVVLDLSRIVAVDKHGAEALEALIERVRTLGAHLQIVSIPGAVHGYERKRYE
jgi:ABC-type transporter Mla MlaB component